MSDSVDYRQYYDLEHYLFDDVSRSFERTGTLSTQDFFCIIIWKANRAKTRIARRMLARGHRSLDQAVSQLTQEISATTSDKEKMRLLIEQWGFRLPMASAILTVLYPRSFTVYDVRVCEVLAGHDDVQNRTKFDNLWAGYQSYIQAVKAAVPANLSLRDKDRWLWGKSFLDQLRRDVRTGFTGPTERDA